MRAEFVLDGSLTMGWCFEDEASPETDEIQDWLTVGACAYVPTLWHLEIANVLLACERGNRITEADSVRFLAVLGLLNITTDHQTEQHTGKTTLGLARQHGLSVYDAAYLELAMRLGLPLASKDEALRKAAQAVGLSILPRDKWNLPAPTSRPPMQSRKRERLPPSCLPPERKDCRLP